MVSVQVFFDRLRCWFTLVDACEQLAYKQAQLDDGVTRGGKRWNAGVPVDMGCLELHSQAVNVLFDLCSLVSKKRPVSWRGALCFVVDHVDVIVRASGFQRVYKRFCVVDERLVKVTKRDEEKRRAGFCYSCGHEIFTPGGRKQTTVCVYCRKKNTVRQLADSVKRGGGADSSKRMLTGSLAQIASAYNLVNRSDLSPLQVRGLLLARVIRGVKVSEDMWIVDVGSLRDS